MMKHFQELCNLCGVSGDEQAVRTYILSVLEHCPQVEWTIDPLGNLFVTKQGKKPCEKRLMISAHMDEVGMIVTHCNADGTLCVESVGGVDPMVAIGRQVLIGAEKFPAVVGTKPVHLMKKEERTRQPKWSELYVDCGAKDQKEAMELAPPGTDVYFMPNFQLMGNSTVASKAIDDRIGCAIILNLLEQDLEYGFVGAFFVQEEVGLRGAKAGTYTVNPDFAMVLEATTAADVAGSTGADRVCELGKGPVVSFMDRSTIYDKELYQMAFSTAKELDIPCQTKTKVAGGNDSGAIHLSRGGVRTLAISVPCRYLHSPSCVANLQDMDAMLQLVSLMQKKIMEEL